jgi:serine/threonine protein kinase
MSASNMLNVASRLASPRIVTYGRTSGTHARGNPDRRVARLALTHTPSSDSDGEDDVATLTGEPGRVFGGKYRLVSLLGRGGMGEVWRAEHLDLHSTVALKLFDLDQIAYAHPASRDKALSRFMAEARAAASLRSTHVVRVFDTGVDHGVPFIAMELLEGETLATRLDRVGSLSPTETVRVLTHIGRAMTEAHQHGITHRDLKPENIFIVSNDEEEIVKVLDFGIAKVAPTALDAALVATASGNLMGTPPYMSPEQAGGAVSVDARSDIWSMGVLAFECLTGTLPFDSQHVGELVLQICSRPLPVPSNVAPVPAGFDAWWARACCRDREQRFQSARELYHALADALGEPGIRAPLGSIPLIAPSSRPPQPRHASSFAETLDAYAVPQTVPRGRSTTYLAIGAGALLLSLGLGLIALRGDTSPSTSNATAAASPPTVAPVPPEPRAVPATPPEVTPSAAIAPLASSAVPTASARAPGAAPSPVDARPALPPAARPSAPTSPKPAPRDRLGL